MKRELLAIALLFAVPSAAQTTPAAPPAAAKTELQKKTEAFVRTLFAWGPSFQVEAGEPTPAPIPGFLTVAVKVTLGADADTALFYVSPDARYFFRGDMFDSTKDLFAENRAKMKLDDSPSKGPAAAKVTVVEYADFQCPSCKALYTAMKELQPKYPQVRFVFRDMPLEQIHPWAVTAAIAGRCVYQANPAAFWKFHDALFDNQEAIKPDNAWQMMLDYGAAAGVDNDTLKGCMISDPAKAAVKASVAEAQALRIANTPTVFVNGRRVVGGERSLLEQYINYELAATKPAVTPAGTPKP